MESALKLSLYNVIMGSALLCGCGGQSELHLPAVNGSEAAAEDLDQLPLYDRAYYARTLPDDGRCRVRSTTDFDYVVYSGNQLLSSRTYPSAEYAAQEATRFELAGRCRKEPEPCSIVKLRSGYTITIQGDRLNPHAVAQWDELARHVNELARNQICTPL